MPRNFMVATERFPEGFYGFDLRPIDKDPCAFLRTVPLERLGALGAEKGVDEAMRMRARCAGIRDPEDFDGALVPASVVAMVLEAHGKFVPLGWAKSVSLHVTSPVPWQRAYVTPFVAVFSGDFLVAICAPLPSSPACQELDA